VAFVFAALSTAVSAAPYRPQHPETVLLRVDPQVQTARASRPGDNASLNTPDAALSAARSYMQRGREQIDERYFGQAEAVLRRALRCVDLTTADTKRCGSDRTSIDLLIAFADVLQHRHDFATAEKLLTAALERAPRHSQARLMRANIRLAAGEPAEAFVDCRALVGSADALIASTCLAQSMALSGQLDQAYGLVRRLTDGLPAQEAAGVAWALAIRAEMEERQGDGAIAAETMLRAVAADPLSYPARLQAADLLKRAGRFRDSLQVLERLPPTEPVVLRRALATRELDATAAPALVAAWRELVVRERDLRAPLHLRDLARGQLELMRDPQAALAAAKDNWRSQRELEDARVFLAAAIAAGRREAAEPVESWLAANRIEDASIDRLVAGSNAL
jgi:tetratricopeptide (TPR) repeat protein